MTSSSSLYGTAITQSTNSGNSTSLYGEAGTPIPDTAGNLVVRGDLVVLSGNILTTAATGNIFPTNATTINLGLAATAVNIGAATGSTTINNTLFAPGADFGNITIGVATDNTITTTSGDLDITATGNNGVNISSGNDAPTLITRNTTAVSSGIRSLALAVQTSGTPTVGFGNSLEWQVETAPGNTENAGFVSVTSTDITPGSEDFRMNFGLMTNGALSDTKMFLESTGKLTVSGDLQVNGANINLAPSTNFLYSENNDRTNRPEFQSTSGNSSGLRVRAPNTTTSASSTFSVNNSSDSANTEFLSLQARGSALGDTFRILTGGFIANVQSASNKSIAFVDNTNKYATVNPAGPTIGTDLTTVNYVAAQISAGAVTSITGTADQVIASSPTGAVTLSLPQSIATTSNPTFAGATLGNVTVGVADNQTITTTSGNLNITAVAASSVNITSETNAPTTIIRNTNNTNIVTRSLALAVQSSGTPAVGLGNSLEYQIETAPGNTESAGFVTVVTDDVTPGSEDFTMRFGLMQAGATSSTKMFLDSTGSLTLDNDLTVGGTGVNLAQGTTISYSENNTRANRPTIQSTTGNSSGLRVLAPNATTSAISNLTVFNTNDINNGKFLSLQTTGSTTQPLTLRTGQYTAGVLGASGEEINITDGGVMYATINPAGPTNTTDLTTKTYVDTLVAGSGVTSITGTANQVIASSPTGAITLSLPQSIATTSNPVFAGVTGGAVTVGVDSDQTVSTSSGNLVLQTAAGVNAGTITMAAGTNGAITFAPNGTGTVVIPTADITNLEVTNIKALDGTAAATIANSTGAVSITTQLTVDNLNINGNTIISTDTNGNITLAPNGTGNVVNTFSNGGNLTNNRNYVFGAIRNATTAAAGDVWNFNATGSVGPLRGISLDNSGDTTKNPGEIIRGYSGSAATGQRGRLVFEKARNTVASPTANQAADLLGSIEATGYSSTGWVNDTIPVSPGTMVFAAAENWVSNTNLGTTYSLNLAPTATTISTAANLVNVVNVNPQTNQSRSDNFTWGSGKSATTFTATGSSISSTTLTIGTVTAGTVAVGQFVQTAVLGVLAGTYIVSNISGSGSGSTWVVSQGQTVASTTITGTSGGMYLNSSGNLDVIGTITARGSSISGVNLGTTYANFTTGSAQITNSGRTTITRSSAGTGLLLRQQTTNANPADGDSTDFRLGVTGTSTSSDFARVDGTYKSSGDNEIGLSVSVDSFAADTDRIYIGSRASTKIRATPSGGGTASDILTVTDTTVTSARPFVFPSYTAAAANAITGAVGWQIAITNSGGGGNPNGMMAFWDTTNARWSYIHDNSAV
jgi:hypothetical protein